MDLKAYLRLLRFHWVAIVLIVALGAASGAAWAGLQKPTYAAKSQMLVTVSSPRQDSSEAYQGALLAQQRARSYTTLLTSQSVLRQIRDELNLPYTVNELKSHIRASNPSDTGIIEVTALDRSTDRALLMAEAVAPVIQRVVTTAEDPGEPGSPGTVGSPSISVRTLERAELLDHPVAPHKAFNIMLGVVVGLVLGVGWAVIRELSVGPVRDPEDLARATDAGLLGVLPRGERHRGRGRQASSHRSAADIEANRWLALTLEASGSGRMPRSFVLATPTPGEATARVAAGLAEAVAESGSRVLVVDAGAAGTELARFLGLETPWGLRDVLERRVPVEKALVPSPGALPLTLLGGGSKAPAQGTPPLRRADLVQLLGQLDLLADVVIVAGPALLEGSTGTILSRAVGRAIVLVEAEHSRGPDVTLAVQGLRTVGVAVLGTVLTGVKGDRIRQFVPAVPAVTRLDGYDRGPGGAQPRTAAWPAAPRPSAPLGPREEP